MAVVSFDLQQREHRGIAVFSKALLKALKQAGAELWLLADLDPPLKDSGLRHAPAAVREEIYQARVLDSLASGYAGPLSRGSEQPQAGLRNPLLRKVIRLAKGARRAVDALRPLRTVALNKLAAINLNTTADNPYLRLERLSYLEDLDGILCTRYFYLNHYRSGTANNPRPIHVLANDFDAVISTAPINIRTQGCATMLQVIHDLIPLEYVPASGEHAGLFSQRMLAAGHGFRFFVSTSTREKYDRLFSQPPCTKSQVLLQPPSLQLTDQPSDFKTSSPLLQPYRYLLFNSSVEPRKNLLFAIRAYRDSGLADQGIRLCVTGQLKKDSYSKAVAAQKDDSVILTGYVDETTKANLFLNSLLILSPSIVEGFGIPVLDAACIGAPVIASDSASHCEIQAQYDFSSLVWICDTRKTHDWSLAMHRLAQAETARIQSIAHERQRRCERYMLMESKITTNFQMLVSDAVRSETAGWDVRG